MTLLWLTFTFVILQPRLPLKKMIKQITSHLDIPIHLVLIRQFPTYMYNLEAGSCLPVHSGLGHLFSRFVVG